MLCTLDIMSLVAVSVKGSKFGIQTKQFITVLLYAMQSMSNCSKVTHLLIEGKSIYSNSSKPLIFLVVASFYHLLEEKNVLREHLN